MIEKILKDSRNTFKAMSPGGKLIFCISCFVVIALSFALVYFLQNLSGGERWIKLF
ncbi:hypothetical protein [uncultured Bacteroides sp.]|uniref:hypothetical protein n=1 Tax=uncultured Bacteroides sp. TaxID=162156 RepID=UPI0026058F0A|nr:hypothetical protein [uncultured Bacteroides sp.]